MHAAPEPVRDVPVHSDAEQSFGVTVPPECAPYWQFHADVAAAQVDAWLPRTPSTVLDVSTDPDRYCTALAAGGHRVVPVVRDPLVAQRLAGCPDQPAGLLPVVGDTRALDWFGPGCVDAILAECGALSRCLATETVVEDAYRILRPGGRMLLCVDSLLLGLARLAEQHRWPELADAPAADVVLVPEADGSLTRCFGADELATLLADAGFDIDWIRPRTVLPPETVCSALDADPTSLSALVETELRVAVQREGEPLGMQLVAAVRKP